MKQGMRVAKREDAGQDAAAPAAVPPAGTGQRAGAVHRAGGENRAEALKAIREMLSEVAEDALRLGIVDCIPLIAAADLAIDDVLAERRP